MVVADERDGVEVAVPGLLDTLDVVVLDRDVRTFRIDPVLLGRLHPEVLDDHPIGADFIVPTV